MNTIITKHDVSVEAMPTSTRKPKLLIVDDDEQIRRMIAARLGDSYEIVETGEAEEAVAMTLEHKPDAILMDLMMPGFSGFELCQSLHTLSYTSRIPIFVVTGQADAKYADHCASIGAKGYFQKPIDFQALRTTLATEVKGKLPERRKHKRVQMRVLLRLSGIDAEGKEFEQATSTENVSAGGFLATCTSSLVKGTPVSVYPTAGGQERYAGRAQAVRKESPGSPWQRYGFEFLETTGDWVLQDK